MKPNKIATIGIMLHKVFGGASGIALTGALGFVVAALTVQAGTDKGDPFYLWISAIACAGIGLATAVAWIFSGAEREDALGDRPREPAITAAHTFGTTALADQGATSIAAGRDVNYYTAPVAQQERPPVSDEPTFDLTFRAAPDDFVHALVTNKTTPAEFHVDVIDVVTEETQATPYPVKWRGFPGEDRRVVREALIDLAQVVTPRHPELIRAVQLRGGRRFGEDTIRKRVHNAEINGEWESGYFRLFSFSEQDGWPARGVDAHAADVPDEHRFFRERISLTVRATRLDTQEEITRRVTIAFVAPTLDERSRQRIVSEAAFRVEAEDTIDPVAEFNELIEQGDAISQTIIGRASADASDAAINTWRTFAEIQIEAHCDRSSLTDFRTIRMPLRRETMAQLPTESWNRLNRVMAQVEVLRACRDTLTANAAVRR